MALDISFKTGIDRTVLKEVSQEILKRAAEKNSQYAVNDAKHVNSVYRAENIGIDLYKGDIKPETAKQIALNNSGLQIQLNNDVLNSIKFLNMKAAINQQKNVEGKMTISINETVDGKPITDVNPKFNSIVSLAAGKDKSGSNPSYKGELLNIKDKEQQKEDIESIFI